VTDCAATIGIRMTKVYVSLEYISKNGYHSNTCPHQSESCPRIEIAAIRERRTALDYTVIVALCWFKYVSIEKNAYLSATIRVIFDWHLCMISANGLWDNIIKHSRRRSNVFEDARFWFCPNNHICPNL